MIAIITGVIVWSIMLGLDSQTTNATNQLAEKQNGNWTTG